MADPKSLKVDDKVKFVSLPDEWADPKYQVQVDSIRFMKQLIKRNYPSRVYQIDEHGYPWIAAKTKKGKIVKHHIWMISEESGWRKVEKRT